MSEPTKSLLKRCLATGIISLCITLAYIFTNDFSSASLKNKYLLLSNGFAIPGLFLVLFGSLIALANHGALDGLTYVLTRLGQLLNPFSSKKKMHNYYDFLEERNRKERRKMDYFLITGLVFLAVCLLFTALFYTLSY